VIPHLKTLSGRLVNNLSVLRTTLASQRCTTAPQFQQSKTAGNHHTCTLAERYNLYAASRLCCPPSYCTVIVCAHAHSHSQH